MDRVRAKSPSSRHRPGPGTFTRTAPRQRRRRHHRLRPLRRHRARRIPAGTGSISPKPSVWSKKRAAGSSPPEPTHATSTRSTEVLRQGLDKFGRVDIAVPNAGVVSYNPIWEWSAEQFRNVLDTNLVGVWHG